MSKRLRITVTGRVQGVSFRVGARRAALRLGLAGSARNQPDGSVYLEAEGDEAALAEFLAWCRQGPGLAEVRSVGYTEHPPAGLTGFSIG